MSNSKRQRWTAELPVRGHPFSSAAREAWFVDVSCPASGFTYHAGAVVLAQMPSTRDVKVATTENRIIYQTLPIMFSTTAQFQQSVIACQLSILSYLSPHGVK